MRKTLTFVAIAALSAAAQGPVKLGVMASPALVVPAFDGSGASSNLGFGGKAAATVEYGLNDKLCLAANAGYMLATWGYEYDNPYGKTTVDGTSHFVSLAAGVGYGVMEKLKVFAGLGVDVPLSGEVTVESSMANPLAAFGGPARIDTKATSDISDDNTEILLVAGAGYKLTEKIGVDARYRFALTEYATDFKLSELLVGVTYAF